MTAVLKPFYLVMGMYPSVLELGPMTEGRGRLLQCVWHLGTRGQVSLQDQRAQCNHLFAGCKGHMKGKKVLEH